MIVVIRWFLRLFIGGILLASAIGKALDLPGFIEVLKTYQAFPEVLLWPLALMVTSVEFVLGVWLLSGWRQQTSALAALWLNAGYAVWMTVSLLRGLELPNCGCFGVFFPQPLRWYSPLEDLVLVGMGGALRWTAARVQEERRANLWGLGIAAAALVTTFGMAIWFHVRYDNAPEQTVPLRSYTAAEYPEAPEPRSRVFGQYPHHRLRIQHLADTQFRFVLEPASAQATAVELAEVDLAHVVAAVPQWLPRDPHLMKIGLIDREWNRQQISFRAESPSVRVHPGGDGFETRATSRVDLARNCLNAGLWEVMLFTVEDGEERIYDHLWFTFPLGLYKQLFELVNGLSYWDYWWSLEHWVDPSGTPVPLERLRTVVREWPVEARARWNEPPPANGEQRSKRKNVLAKPVTAYRDWYTQPVWFASFIPPGRYSLAHPRDTQLHYLAELTGATLRQVRLPQESRTLVEIELAFRDGKTSRPTKLIFGGYDPRALPKRPPSRYDEGWTVPMGIGNPSFFETYDDVLTHPPLRRTFYGVHLDAQNRWVDHHAVGVDGPLMHLDAEDPSMIHLYLLAYERHALLNHFVIRCPGDDRGRPVC